MQFYAFVRKDGTLVVSEFVRGDARYASLKSNKDVEKYLERFTAKNYNVALDVARSKLRESRKR